jgi:ParB family transcriptional regulator, chromosome partitioning protein
MARKITYKEPNQALTKIAAPDLNSNNRASVGMDEFVKEYYFIAVEKLLPYKNQARTTFDQAELDNLAATILAHGIRQPLTIIKSSDNEGFYEVISGERRLRAAKIVGLKKVPCIILDDIKHRDEIALIENIQRANLHPIELARGLKKLIDQYGWGGQLEVERRLGIPQSDVSKFIKMLELSTVVQQALIDHNYTGRDKTLFLLKLANDTERLEYIKTNKKSSTPKKAFAVLNVACDNGSVVVTKNFVHSLTLEQKNQLCAILQDLANQLEKL